MAILQLLNVVPENLCLELIILNPFFRMIRVQLAFSLGPLQLPSAHSMTIMAWTLMSSFLLEES